MQNLTKWLWLLVFIYLFDSQQDTNSSTHIAINRVTNMYYHSCERSLAAVSVLFTWRLTPTLTPTQPLAVVYSHPLHTLTYHDRNVRYSLIRKICLMYFCYLEYQAVVKFELTSDLSAFIDN